MSEDNIVEIKTWSVHEWREWINDQGGVSSTPKEDVQAILYNWEKEKIGFISELEKCRAENKELNHVFDFQLERMDEADKLWQEATGKHETIPDLGVLLEWLMAEVKRLEAILGDKGICF